MIGASTVLRGVSCGALALAGLCGAALAQEVTDQQIIRALTPPLAAPPVAAPAAPRTRGLSLGTPAAPTAPQAAPQAAPKVAADDAFIEGLRNRPSRSLSLGDREKLGSVAASRPQIDLPMEFDSNSDVLRGEALTNANALGRALSSPGMKGLTFLIAGHTDAKGGDDVNQRLSERRADAVKQFLVQTYAIPAASLITVGYGKGRLRNAADPLGRENRRVQAVNLMPTRTAGR